MERLGEHFVLMYIYCIAHLSYARMCQELLSGAAIYMKTTELCPNPSLIGFFDNSVLKKIHVVLLATYE